MKPQYEKALEFGEITLRPGARYRVILEFRDVDGKPHCLGEEWIFLGYDFFPYDAGYTLFVLSTVGAESVIRMQDHPQEQEHILKSFHQYVALSSVTQALQ